MSQLQPNEKIGFRARANVVSRPIKDDYDNYWIIEITGEPDAVDRMIDVNDGKLILLKAIPSGRETSDKDWLRAEESMVDSSTEPESAFFDDPFPGLYVDVTLLSVTDPGSAYAFHIEIDPKIFGGYHLYRFRLRTRDLHLRVGVIKNAGNVGYSSYSSDEGFTGHATVWHLDGNPAEYDIVTHAEGNPIN